MLRCWQVWLLVDFQTVVADWSIIKIRRDDWLIFYLEICILLNVWTQIILRTAIRMVSVVEKLMKRELMNENRRD